MTKTAEMGGLARVLAGEYKGRIKWRLHVSEEEALHSGCAVDLDWEPDQDALEEPDMLLIDGEPAGLLYDDGICIQRLEVAPKWRRKGVATLMLLDMYEGEIRGFCVSDPMFLVIRHLCLRMEENELGFVRGEINPNAAAAYDRAMGT